MLSSQGLLRRWSALLVLGLGLLPAPGLQAQVRYYKNPGGMLFLPVPAAPVAPAAADLDVRPVPGAAELLETLQPLSAPEGLEGQPQAKPVPEALPISAEGYLSEADGKSGVELLKALHDISGRGYNTRSYGAARWYMFSSADNIVSHGVNGVLEAYTQLFVPGTGGNGADYAEHGDQNGDHFDDVGGMNAEHVWPQSFFEKASPMRSDLHHLLPTFMHPNSVRGHLPFGEVEGPARGYSNPAGAKLGEDRFEPPDAAKGRVARALLYFYVRYYDRKITSGGFGPHFWSEKLDTILRWNRTFPPDDNERLRNDRVQQFQGNRNPFVDDPGLAERIGLDALRAKPPLP